MGGLHANTVMGEGRVREMEVPCVSGDSSMVRVTDF